MAYKDEPKTIHDLEEDDVGNSLIYVGIKYLKLVADQMKEIRDKSELAWIDKEDNCFAWLYALRIFYDMIESRTGLRTSTKEIESFEYKLEDNRLVRVKIKIKEKNKYEKYFSEIENMIERNQKMLQVQESKIIKYNNDKKICVELSRCTRELFRDANKHHLIMPEGMENIKDMAKKDWIDRGAKKTF